MRRETILETQRLTLTTWSPIDVEDLHRLHSDPATMRYVRHGRPESRAECAALLACYISDQSTGWAKWRLVDASGHMIGRAGFGLLGDARELSYTIRRDRWGQGLATEVGAALVSWHRDNSRDHVPLSAHAAVGNPASARVLVKLGFVASHQEELVGELCDVFSLPTSQSGAGSAHPT